MDMTGINDLFDQPLVVVNVGLKIFHESLKAQGALCVHVDWRPPAGGDPKILEILEKLGS